MNAKKPQRQGIGVLGGAFDPFHQAHLAMALAAYEQLQLEQVILMPTFAPAHKPTALLPFDQRLKLLELAKKPYPWLEVSSLEASLPTPSYTVNTLEALHRNLQHKAHKPLKISLILGEDAFNSLPSWFEWQKLPSLCKIAVFPRQDSGERTSINTIESELAVTWLKTPLWSVSSSLIRSKLERGQSIAHLVPPEVTAGLAHLLRTPVNPWCSQSMSTTVMTKKESHPKNSHQPQHDKGALLKLVLQQLDDQKAKDVEVIDLQGAAQFADTMIVASGTSSRHVAALARGVQDKVKEVLHFKALGIEGLETAEWVLVDFGDTIVHIMLPATRQFYELEKLWKVRPDQHHSTNEAPE